MVYSGIVVMLVVRAGGAGWVGGGGGTPNAEVETDSWRKSLVDKKLSSSKTVERTNDRTYAAGVDVAFLYYGMLRLTLSTSGNLCCRF